MIKRRRSIRVSKKAYTGIFIPAEEGGWVAKCAEVPSAITQGETLPEARKNLKEAIAFMLEVEAKESLAQLPRNARIERIA